MNLKNKIIKEKTDTDLSKLSIEELYNICKFNVLKGSGKAHEDEGKWYLYESICKLGGCDFDGIEFDSEREALEEGTRRSLNKEMPNMQYPCPKCHEEYMRDCI